MSTQSNTSNTFELQSIGGGPRFTYWLRQFQQKIPAVQRELQEVLSDPAKLAKELDALPKPKKKKRAGTEPVDMDLKAQDIQNLLGDISTSVVEPSLIGAGRVWTPVNNPEHQYSNTLANQLTACADASSTIAQHEDGPSFKEWLERDFEQYLDGRLQEWCEINYPQNGQSERILEFLEIYDWLDKSLGPYVKEKFREAEGKPISLQRITESWKKQKFETWFNGKAYGDPEKMSYLEGGIQIAEQYYAPRFLHGLYLNAMALDAASQLPDNARFRLHASLATDMEIISSNGNARAKVVLEDGGSHVAHEVLMLKGQSENLPDATAERLINFAKKRPNTAEYSRASHMLKTVDKLKPGEVLGIEGMGLTAIDAVAAATEGKGGKFERDENGILRYIPSGLEPMIYMSSISGTPPAGRPVNQKPTMEPYQAKFFTPKTIRAAREDKFQKLREKYGDDALKEQGITAETVQLDLFAKKTRLRNYDPRTPINSLLPEIDPNNGIPKLNTDSVICDLYRDMEYAFYLASEGPEFAKRYEAAAHDETKRFELLFELPSERRLNFAELIDPVNTQRPTGARQLDAQTGGFIDVFNGEADLSGKASKKQFDNEEDYQKFIAERLRLDLQKCREGNINGDLKAATDVLRDLRNNLRELTEQGGITPGSMRFLPLFDRLNNRLAVGPPDFRIEEHLALMEAGVLKFMGPNTRILTPEGESKFQMLSPTIRSKEDSDQPLTVAVDVIINAHSDNKNNINRTTCPLTRKMVDRGILRPFKVEDTLNTRDSYVPGGADIDEYGRLIGRNGKVIPNVYGAMVGDNGSKRYMQNAARLGVDSSSIGDISVIASENLQRYKTFVLKRTRDLVIERAQTRIAALEGEKAHGGISSGVNGTASISNGFNVDGTAPANDMRLGPFKRRAGAKFTDTNLDGWEPDW